MSRRGGRSCDRLNSSSETEERERGREGETGGEETETGRETLRGGERERFKLTSSEIICLASSLMSINY